MPGAEHDERWGDRLLDWVDGDLAPAAAAQFEAHLAACATCQEQSRALKRLDASLREALPRLSLDASFDARLFARIDAMNDKQRIAARRRAEQELHDNLQSLSHRWKRTLGLLIPSMIAGLALAFALTTWLSDAGIMQSAVTESVRGLSSLGGARGAVGGGMAFTVQLVLMAAFGSGIGLLFARWLASSAD